MFELDYCDQDGARAPVASGVLSWSEGVPITARQLIVERLRREFERYDAKGADLPAALIPFDRNGRAITLDEAADVALRAFAANRFFLLVDRRQIVDPDQSFLLKPKSSIVFLRLTPLKGG